MRCLKRNKRSLWYCLYKQTDIVTDTYGNEVGQHVVYEQPVQMYANISQATGWANNEQFGNLENYDKVIVTDDLACPIDENTVLFVDKNPEYADRDEPDDTPVSDDTEGGDDTPAEREEETEPAEDPEPTPEPEPEPEPEPTPPVYTGDPLYDYIVVRVSKSLNSVSIAIRRVDVS